MGRQELPTAHRSPLLKQILRHLNLVGGSTDGDDPIVGALCRLVNRDAGPRVHANFADAGASLADDCPRQLQIQTTTLEAHSMPKHVYQQQLKQTPLESDYRKSNKKASKVGHFLRSSFNYACKVN